MIPSRRRDDSQKNISGTLQTVRNAIRSPIKQSVVLIAKYSAKRPIITVMVTMIASVSLLFIGLRTNYHFETNSFTLWTPPNTQSRLNRKLIENLLDATESSACDTNNFENITNETCVESSGSLALTGFIHKNGDDVATMEGMDRMFEVINLIRDLDSYNIVCGGEYSHNCSLIAPTIFWENHNYTEYQGSNIHTDEDVKERLSSFIDYNGDIINRDYIFGDLKPESSSDEIAEFTKKEMRRIIIGDNLASVFGVGRNASNIFDQANIMELYDKGLGKTQEKFELTYVKSLLFTLKFPNNVDGRKFGKEAIKILLALNDKWDIFKLRAIESVSFDDEVIRSVVQDAPLMATAFLVMTVYCCLSLSKYHRINSRSLLGVGAVFSVLMSVAAGYGIMFVFGISLTPLSYLLPYGLLGLGLDDTFILTGAFERTDSKKDVVDRVVDTFTEVGLSITVTTLTTVIAYSLGIMSSLPGVKWFCIYAALNVTIVFFNQITFFVALIVLDDRRRKAQRLDCLICFKSNNIVVNEPRTSAENEDAKKKSSFGSRLMSAYTRILLTPVSKAVVLTLFTTLFVGSAYIASGMTQFLDLKETLLKDSFVRNFMSDLEKYNTRSWFLQSTATVYFRNVDVSDAEVQGAMKKYVDDLVDMPQVSSQPVAFWLRDFDEFLLYHSSLRNDKNKTFHEKLDIFLTTPPYDKIYSNQIRRDANGTVVASWTHFSFDKLGMHDAPRLIEATRKYKEVTKAQPINQNSLSGPFFVLSELFDNSAMWDVLIKEVMQTIVTGLATLFVISLLFIPHATGAFILTPTVFAIFVEVIAVMRLAGLHFDPFTSIGLITCLGIVMDYNMHVFQAYLELETFSTRNEKVIKMMECMGKSVMQCGLTNLLGVLPLAFNSTIGFRTMFVTFLAFTSVGIGHGLAFLPVVLSLVGPINEPKSKGDSRDRDSVDADTISVTSLRSRSGKSSVRKVIDDLPMETAEI